MIKKWQLNLSLVLPLALWGFALISLNFRILKETIPAELQLGIVIAFAALNILFLLYYFILRCYLKLVQKDSPTSQKLIPVCGLAGTLFTFIAFLS